MEWYWIILIVVVWLFGWGATIAIADKEVDDSEAGAFIGFIWPLLLPVYLGIKFIKGKKK